MEEGILHVRRAVGLGMSTKELVFHCPLAGTVVRLLRGQIPLALLSHCKAPCPGIFSPGARRALWRQQPSGMSFAPQWTCCRAGSREWGKRIAPGQMEEQGLVWSAASPELVDGEMVLVSRTVAVTNSISLVKDYKYSFKSPDSEIIFATKQGLFLLSWCF